MKSSPIQNSWQLADWYMKLYLRKSFGFDVLWVVPIRSSTFWDIMLCTLVKVNRHLGVTYCLNLQDQRLSHALLAACFVLVSCLAYFLILKMVTCSLKKKQKKNLNFTRLWRYYTPEETPLHLRNSALPETTATSRKFSHYYLPADLMTKLQSWCWPFISQRKKLLYSTSTSSTTSGSSGN